MTNISHRFVPGRILSPAETELNEIGTLLGTGADTSNWDESVWDRVKQYEPDVLAVQSLYPVSEGLPREDQLLKRQTQVARAWATLPGNINSVNGSDTITMVFGDRTFPILGPDDDEGGFAERILRRGWRSGLAGAGLGVAGAEVAARRDHKKLLDRTHKTIADLEGNIAINEARMADYEDRFGSPASPVDSVRENYEGLLADERVRLNGGVSRRSFLKWVGVGALHGGLTYAGLARIASRIGESADEGILQSTAEFVADKAPLVRNTPYHHYIRGRLAIQALKGMDAASSLVAEDQSATAVTVFGTSAVVSREAAHQFEDALSAVRDLATIGYESLIRNEDRTPSVELGQEVVSRLAVMDVLHMKELDAERYEDRPSSALDESVVARERVQSPMVLHALESWTPPKIDE